MVAFKIPTIYDLSGVAALLIQWGLVTLCTKHAVRLREKYLYFLPLRHGVQIL